MTTFDKLIGSQQGRNNMTDLMAYYVHFLDRLSHTPTLMTGTQTLTTQDKVFGGHGLLTTASRGHGMRMSPGLIGPCHFSPRVMMQSLTSAAMIANVLQALTDDSDSVSTTSPDSNLSSDSVECNLTPRSDSNHGSVAAGNIGGTDAGVPRAMFSTINTGFVKHPINDTVSGKGVGNALGEGGDYCSLENPSGGDEGATAMAKGELLIGDCEIDTELTSKEKTKQWLASPGGFLWKDKRKMRDQEVRGHNNERLDDADSLSGSAVDSPTTPRSGDIDIQDEVEKLANLFTRLEAGSSEVEASGKTLACEDNADPLRQDEGPSVKGRMRASRGSLRLPKPRASSSSSLGHKSPMVESLHKASMQRSSGSLDRDSSESPGQWSAESLDLRRSTGSLGHLCSGSANQRSRDSMHPTSLGSSVQSSSSSVADHLVPTVSEIERRLTNLIGQGEGISQECEIRPDDIRPGYQAMGQQLTNREEDAKNEAEKPDNNARFLHRPTDKNFPKSSLNKDAGKCGEKRHLKRRGNDEVDQLSGGSTNFEKDSLEKSATPKDKSSTCGMTSMENLTGMIMTDSSSMGTYTFESDCDSCSMTKTDMGLSMTESVLTSLDVTEVQKPASMESDSLNRKGARKKIMRQKRTSDHRRGMIIRHRQMLFAGSAENDTVSNKTKTNVSLATAPTSVLMDSSETTSMASYTISGKKTEYDSDGTWTDDTDHVADSEREDSDESRTRNSKDSLHWSNQRFERIAQETISGLHGLLDTGVSGKEANFNEAATGSDATRESSGKIRALQDNTDMVTLHQTNHSGATLHKTAEGRTGLTRVDKGQTSSRRARHTTGHVQMKEDETLTNTEADTDRKTSDGGLSHLGIDPDSLTEMVPFVSPTSTNQTLLGRSEEYLVYSDLASKDLSQLMVQGSERMNKSEGHLPLFVSPLQSRIVTRNDMNSEFLMSSELDKELCSPHVSATQLSCKSESADVTEEFQSSLESASNDDTEEGFVTPDEQSSLSPDVDDWLFDSGKANVADIINELKIGEFINSRSATPLVSYDADSLGSDTPDMMSPSSQSLVDSDSRGSPNIRVACFVSPDQSKVHVAEKAAAVSLESEPVNQVAPRPHAQTPVEDEKDKELEVTSSDDNGQESAGEQAPGEIVLGISRQERITTPVVDMCPVLGKCPASSSPTQITSVNCQNDMSDLRGSMVSDCPCKPLFSQLTHYSGTDDVVDDGGSSPALHPFLPDSSGQRVTESNKDANTVLKQEPTSHLNEVDVNNCSSGDSIGLKDCQSDHSCQGKLQTHGEVSSSEEDSSCQPFNVRTYEDLQKEIADVIGPVLGTAPTIRGAQNSAMSDVLKLAFSCSLKTAIAGFVVHPDERSEQVLDNDRKDSPDSAQSGPIMILQSKHTNPSCDTNCDQIFGYRTSGKVNQLSTSWSNLIETGSDLGARLTAVIQQDKPTRSSASSTKSSEIDISETDSEKSTGMKRQTVGGSWDADVSSQSETEAVPPIVNIDPDFVSVKKLPTIDKGLNTTILGQSEHLSQDNMCQDSSIVSKNRDKNDKFIMHSDDKPLALLPVAPIFTGVLAPVSSDFDELCKKCDESNTFAGIEPVTQLCTDVDGLQLTMSDLPCILSNRETNISRPSTTKTLRKLSRPPSLLAVVTEDDAEEKPDAVASEELNDAMPSSGAMSSSRQRESISDTGTLCDKPLVCTPKLQLKSLTPSVSSTPDSGECVSAQSTVSSLETIMFSGHDLRLPTETSGLVVESSGRQNEGTSNSLVVTQAAPGSLEVPSERRRTPSSSLPLPTKIKNPSADSPQKNVGIAKTPHKSDHISTDCKSASYVNGKDACKKLRVSSFMALQKVLPTAAGASSETLQRRYGRPSKRHPSSPLPRSSNIEKSKVVIEPCCSMDQSGSESITKKPMMKHNKTTAKCNVIKKMDDSPSRLTPIRQRYASAGMAVRPSTSGSSYTRIPSAVSLRALSHDHNVQARVESRLAYFSPKERTVSPRIVKNSTKQSRPGEMHSARSTSKLNRHNNKHSKSRSPSKRLSKSVDCLDRVERSSKRVGQVVSEAKATKIISRNIPKKAVTTVHESNITVKLPSITVTPVTTNLLKDIDKIDTHSSKEEENVTSVVGGVSVDGQSKQLIDSKPVTKAAISIQTDQLKKSHKKKQKKKIESSVRDKNKHLDEESESDAHVAISVSHFIDAKLSETGLQGTSRSKKNLAEQPSPCKEQAPKVDKRSVATSAKMPRKRSVSTLQSAKSPFKIALKQSEQRSTSVGRPASVRSSSKSPSPRICSRMSSPGRTSSRRVHYDVESLTGDYEVTRSCVSEPVVAQTDTQTEEKQERLVMMADTAKPKDVCLDSSTDEGVSLDEPEMVVIGKALKLLQSPASMKVKTICVAHDNVPRLPSPARIVHSTDMYIVCEAVNSVGKNHNSKKVLKPYASTDEAAVKSTVVKPVAPITRKSTASPLINVVNFSSETRYSDGQIRRDKTKESVLCRMPLQARAPSQTSEPLHSREPLHTMSNDRNTKTKIPCRKKSGSVSGMSLPEISITKYDAMFAENLNAAQKFPKKLAKAVSDMVISKTDSITEDIVYQLRNNKPGAGKDTDGTSPQFPSKPTPRKNVPETNVINKEKVKTYESEPDTQLTGKQSKQKCPQSHQSVRSASPTSSVKSLIQSSNHQQSSGNSASQQPALTHSNKSLTIEPSVTRSSKSPTRQRSVMPSSKSPTRQQLLTQSSKSPNRQRSLTQSSKSPKHQQSMTQSSKSPTCQRSVTQSSKSLTHQPSLALSNKSLTRQRSMTQSSKSPMRQQPTAQSNKSPTRQRSMTQSSKSLTCQQSLTQTNKSPTQQSVISDIALNSAIHGNAHSEDSYWNERLQAAQDSYKSSRLMHKEDEVGNQNIMTSAINVNHIKNSVSSSQKTNAQKPKKSNFGNTFTNTAFLKWREFSKLLEVIGNEDCRQSDIVAILQKCSQMQARVNARNKHVAGEGKDASPPASYDSVTPEGMSDNKALDSTLVTAASVIIQTRDMVMQQLNNEGDSVTNETTVGVDGRTATEQGSIKGECDDNVAGKLGSAARAANMMKKDAASMLTCITKTSNEILNYMSTDQIDVTTCLLKQLQPQQEEGKDINSSDSVSSSNTSLYPSKVEPMSWMSLAELDDTSEKQSSHSSDEQKSETPHKKKSGKKSHNMTQPSPWIKPVPESQHSIIKKLLNLSHHSLHIGGEKAGSYTSTLHKKTTLRKLMYMKNPRAQVKKLLQKSQDTISLTRKDLEVLRQGPWRRSRKQAVMHNQNRGWRANWDDIATVEPPPVIKKKRSCSGTSSIRSHISNLSATKRRSHSALNDPSKTELPANSNMTKTSPKIDGRPKMPKMPLCLDLKLLLNDSEKTSDDLLSSPCSTLTESPLPHGTVIAENNSQQLLSTESDLSTCKKVLSSDSEMDSPRNPVLSPYKDSHCINMPLPSEGSGSISSETFYSAESKEATTKQTLSTDSKDDGNEQSVLGTVEKKDHDSKQALSLKCRDIVSEDNAKSSTATIQAFQLSASERTGAVTNYGKLVEKDGALEHNTMSRKQLSSYRSKDNGSFEHVSLIPRRHSFAGSMRHPSAGSKSSVSVDSLNWRPKKNVTPGIHSSTGSLKNVLNAGGHSSRSSQESHSADMRDKFPKQISSPRSKSQLASPDRGDLSSRSASQRSTRTNALKKTDQVDHQDIRPEAEFSTAADALANKQETIANKVNSSPVLNLSTLPKLDLHAAALDMLLPSSIERNVSSDAVPAGALVKDPNNQDKLAPSQNTDTDDDIPVVAKCPDHKNIATKESSRKSSKVRSHGKCKVQSYPNLKGMKLYPCKNDNVSKKTSPLDENKMHNDATHRPRKSVTTKKTTTNVQLRRTASTAKKYQLPQNKQQAHRKPAVNKDDVAIKKALSLDGELNMLKTILSSQFGSSSESVGTASSSKISMSSVTSSTDDLSELTTDQSTSPRTMAKKKTHTVSHARKHLVEESKGRHMSNERGDRGEPQMKDITTDPMFAWHYEMPPNNDIQCPVSPFSMGQLDLMRQYMSSYPYAASSEIVQSLSELESFISELSFLVDSKNLPESNPCCSAEEPRPNKIILSTSNHANGDIVESFFDIATFASNLATSLEEISSSGTAVDSTHKESWKENIRANALLNNTCLGRVYLQQMANSPAVAKEMGMANVDETVSYNNDEFSDDQVGMTDFSFSSISSTTSTSSRVSVITPRQNGHTVSARLPQSKSQCNAIARVSGEKEHGVRKPEVNSLHKLTNCGSGHHYNSEAPTRSYKSNNNMSESTQESLMDDSMYTTASDVDFTDTESFFSDDDMADVGTLVDSPRDSPPSQMIDRTMETQRTRQSSSTSSCREMRGIKRKGTMALEKNSSKSHNKQLPSGPLNESYQSMMPSLEQQELNQTHVGLSMIGSCTSVPDNKNIIRDSSETSSCATHSSREFATTKQLSDHDVFNLIFTYLGPEKAHAYLEKSASHSSYIKPVSSVEATKNSGLESMCPSRGTSSSSNNTVQSSGVINGIPGDSQGSSFSKPSSHLSPLSLMPSDSILLRDAMPGDRVGLPSAALLKKVELFYNQQMNGTGSDPDLSQFMQWLHSGISSSSPAERALHSALRFYQSRPPGDAQLSELSGFPLGTTEKYPGVSVEQHGLSDSDCVQEQINLLHLQRKSGKESSSDHSFHHRHDHHESLTPSGEVLLRRTGLANGNQQIRAGPSHNITNIIEAHSLMRQKNQSHC